MNVLFALLLGLLPGLVWLVFFLREDEHPEPKKMIAGAFIAGGIAAFLSLGLEVSLSGLLEKLVITLPKIFEQNIVYLRDLRLLKRW
jgi:RsiW-degrading membrane proteinase PrsW (M82 family)